MRKKCFQRFKVLTNKLIETSFCDITEKLFCGYISYLGWSGWSNCYSFIKKTWLKIMPKINYYYDKYKKSKKKKLNYLFMIGTNLYDKIFKKHKIKKQKSFRYTIHKKGGLIYGTIF